MTADEHDVLREYFPEIVDLAVEVASLRADLAQERELTGGGGDGNLRQLREVVRQLRLHLAATGPGPIQVMHHPAGEKPAVYDIDSIRRNAEGVVQIHIGET